MATQIYKGRSNSNSDIINTFDGKYLYKGRSKSSSDILKTTEGNILVFFLFL